MVDENRHPERTQDARVEGRVQHREPFESLTEYNVLQGFVYSGLCFLGLLHQRPSEKIYFWPVSAGELWAEIAAKPSLIAIWIA
jgi:hypothetical protein